jgi:hypothetical protein
VGAMVSRTRQLLSRVCALLVLTMLSFACGSTPPTTPASAKSALAPGPHGVDQVLVVSIDGLNPLALDKLGRKGTPVLHRLRRQGASTLNARTSYEMTVTLPNHTGMVTSRRINAADGGHGVTWNDDRPTPATVQAAAGGPVGSVFSDVIAAGATTALFASKTKFSLWQRSWPAGLKNTTIELDNRALADDVALDLIRTDRDFTFVHLSGPDVAGHARGWMSRPYLRAVRAADTNLGIILEALKEADEVDDTLVIVTADHGGVGRLHGQADRLANYRIPFLVRGPDVPRGADLYEISPANRDPGTRRPSYGPTRQPVRNTMVANLALQALGLPAIKGSQLNVKQDLNVFEAP